MTLITTSDALAELCEEIDQCGRFAIDLEFIPERTYRPVLCLIQVATDKGVHLIDPLVQQDLMPLWQRFHDENIRTIIHAASQDLDLIYDQFQTLPGNIFDTQVASGFAGLGYQIGYGRLVAQLLNVSLSKTESFTDWLTRPLTEAQLSYAADDVRHLLPLYDAISERLNALGRFEWADEECKRYCAPEHFEDEGRDAYLKVKGASVLDRRGLAVLKHVFAWRDQTAQRLNKPPRTILSDSLLVEVSRKPPHKVEDLSRIRGMRPDQIKGFGQGIVRAAQEGRSTQDGDLPQWPSSRGPSKRDVLVGDMLFAILKVIAYEEDLATELLSTRDDLQQLIKLHRENKLSKEKSTPLIKGWRYELAGKKLISMLEGNDLTVSIGSMDSAPIEMKFGANTR